MVDRAIFYVLLAVFGGQIIATDTLRLIEYYTHRKSPGFTALDRLLAMRCVSTTLFVVTEVVSMAFYSFSHRQFPMAIRCLLMAIALPITSITSFKIYRYQIARRMVEKNKEVLLTPCRLP